MKSYLIVNLIFAGMIMMTLFYSGLFSARQSNHPVPSFYEIITGDQAPSSGMSKAFSELVRGRTESARLYNEDSILIFSFFLIQLSLRVIFSLIIIMNIIIKHRFIIAVDIIFSTVLFFFCFKNQIFKMTGLFLS